MKKLLVFMGIGASLFFTVQNHQLPFLDTIVNAQQKPNSSANTNRPSNNNPLRLNCKIKGNISHNSGRRIYHIPGQQDYENTRIQPEHGERYFCTEEEARRAGWVKAPR